jgi:hypothetical protein
MMDDPSLIAATACLQSDTVLFIKLLSCFSYLRLFQPH